MLPILSLWGGVLSEVPAILHAIISGCIFSLDKCINADVRWKWRGECASVMTRQTERMVLAAYLIFSPFIRPRLMALMRPMNRTTGPLMFFLCVQSWGGFNQLPPRVPCARLYQR